MSWTRWLNALASSLSRKSGARRTQKQASKPHRSHRMTVEHLEDRVVPSTSVWTDKPDYAPGSTAVINGSGFQVGEAVHLEVLRSDGVAEGGPDNPWTVTDGGAGDLDGVADGNFTTSWYVNPLYATDQVLSATATGLSSGLIAQTVFTDAVASPTGFRASAVPTTTNKIELSWTDNSADETYFLISRSTSPTFPNNGTIDVATVPSTTTAGVGASYSYTDTGLSPGTTSYYFDWGRYSR
jgi:hypothetical protein